jgi:hypothetical protein
LLGDQARHEASSLHPGAPRRSRPHRPPDQTTTHKVIEALATELASAELPHLNLFLPP